MVYGSPETRRLDSGDGPDLSWWATATRSSRLRRAFPTRYESTPGWAANHALNVGPSIFAPDANLLRTVCRTCGGAATCYTRLWSVQHHRGDTDPREGGV